METYPSRSKLVSYSFTFLEVLPLVNMSLMWMYIWEANIILSRMEATAPPVVLNVLSRPLKKKEKGKPKMSWSKSFIVLY